MTALFVLTLIALVVFLETRSGRKQLEQLQVDHSLSVPVTEPDEALELTLTIQNRSWFFFPFLRYQDLLPEGLEVEVDRGHIREGAQGRSYLTGTTWLLPHQKVEKTVRIVPRQRGCYVFGDLTVYSGDFLGIRQRAHSLERRLELVVYPRAAARREVSQVFGGFLGEVSVRRFIQEDPVLTLGFREYTGREPMKSISWLQSARKGQLMVKNYDHTLEPSVSVLLNIQGGNWQAEQEEVERCYSLARSVCAELEGRGVKYDFRTNALCVGEVQPPEYRSEGLGSKHFYGILEQLGRGTRGFRVPCETMVERALGGMTAGRGIIFITPGDDPGPERLARRLAGEKGGTLLVLTAKEGALC